MADGYLTTHVLDTAQGIPAQGIGITLFRLDGDTRQKCASTVTNADGRTDAPILPKGHCQPGTYELVFDVQSYLMHAVGQERDQLFLDIIPIRFSMTDPQAHYHVPLLLSPFSYSTYRGS